MFGKISILFLILAFIMVIPTVVISIEFMFVSIILILFWSIFLLLHWGIEVYGAALEEEYDDGNTYI